MPQGKGAFSSPNFQGFGLNIGLSLLGVLLTLFFWFNPAGGPGVGFSQFPLDDAWIHLVYARSLATELRPEYNPGQVEAGMTSPLWVVLNAALYHPARLLGLNPSLAPKFLSMIFGVGAAALVMVIVRRRTRGLLAPLAASLLLTVDPGWSFSRASGMEATLAGFLVLAVYNAWDRGRDLVLGAALGLSLLARPEAILLCVLVLPIRGWDLIREKAPWTRGMGLFVFPVLAISAWATFNLLVTGHPLPNSFYVKAQMDPSFFLPVMGSLIAFNLPGGTGLASLPFGLLVLRGIGGLLGTRKLRDSAWALFPLLFLLGLTFTRTFSGEWAFSWARYAHPVFPIMAVLAGIGISGGGIGGKFSNPSPPGKSLFPAAKMRFLTGTLAMAALALSLLEIPERAALFSRNSRDILIANVRMGEWIRDNAPPGKWVATMDAGAIRYFSGHPVLDLGMLNNNELLHHPGSGSSKQALENKLSLLLPPYFILFPRWNPVLIDSLGLIPLAKVENPDYSVLRNGDQSTMVLYLAPWAQNE